MTTRSTYAALLGVLLSFTGCSKKKDEKPATGQAPPPSARPADTQAPGPRTTPTVPSPEPLYVAGDEVVTFRPFEAFDLSPDGSLMAVTLCSQKEQGRCRDVNVYVYKTADGSRAMRLGRNAADSSGATLSFRRDNAFLAVAGCRRWVRDQRGKVECAAGAIDLVDLKSASHHLHREHCIDRSGPPRKELNGMTGLPRFVGKETVWAHVLADDDDSEPSCEDRLVKGRIIAYGIDGRLLRSMGGCFSRAVPHDLQVSQDGGYVALVGRTSVEVYRVDKKKQGAKPAEDGADHVLVKRRPVGIARPSKTSLRFLQHQSAVLGIQEPGRLRVADLSSGKVLVNERLSGNEQVFMSATRAWIVARRKGPDGTYLLAGLAIPGSKPLGGVLSDPRLAGQIRASEDLSVIAVKAGPTRILLVKRNPKVDVSRIPVWPSPPPPPSGSSPRAAPEPGPRPAAGPGRPAPKSG